MITSPTTLLEFNRFTLQGEQHTHTHTLDPDETELRHIHLYILCSWHRLETNNKRHGLVVVSGMALWEIRGGM